MAARQADLACAIRQEAETGMAHLSTLYRVAVAGPRRNFPLTKPSISLASGPDHDVSPRPNPIRNCPWTACNALFVVALFMVAMGVLGCVPLTQTALLNAPPSEPWSSDLEILETATDDSVAWETTDELENDLHPAVVVDVSSDEANEVYKQAIEIQVEPEFDFDTASPASGQPGGNLESDVASLQFAETQAVWSISDVIAYARAHHPKAVAAKRRVDQARANVRYASAADNPEFVLDVETPVHDGSDPTQLSTRVTFPIFRGRERDARRRLARSEVSTANAWHRTVVQQLSDTALLAALRLAYLQQRANLDALDHELAEERLGLLSPQQRPGDPAGNLVDYVDAASDAQRASRRSFETRRDLALARVDLSEAMGMDPVDLDSPSEGLWVEPTPLPSRLDLPPMQQVVSSMLSLSYDLQTSRSQADNAWLQQQVIRNRALSSELGPLYEDRLGRADDSIGIRFQSDLPLFDHNRSGVAMAGFQALAAEEDAEAKRLEIANSVARDYQELRTIARQLADLSTDGFVASQETILRDAAAAGVMTGNQELRIRQMVLDHRRRQMELEHRFVMLRSKLRLHALAGSN